MYEVGIIILSILQVRIWVQRVYVSGLMSHSQVVAG